MTIANSSSGSSLKGVAYCSSLRRTDRGIPISIDNFSLEYDTGSW